MFATSLEVDLEINLQCSPRASGWREPCSNVVTALNFRLARPSTSVCSDNGCASTALVVGSGLRLETGELRPTEPATH